MPLNFNFYLQAKRDSSNTLIPVYILTRKTKLVDSLMFLLRGLFLRRYHTR